MGGGEGGAVGARRTLLPSTIADPMSDILFCLISICGNPPGTKFPEANHIMYLLRFSKAEYHSETLKNEELRFTPIEEWKNLEGLDPARGDAWEGADRIDQPDNVKKVRIRFESDPSLGWATHELAGPVITRNGQAEYPATHGLCFNIVNRQMLVEAMAQRSEVLDFHRFCSEFGPSLLVVTNVSNFLDLTIAAIKKASPHKIEYSSHGPVKYVADNHHGKYSIYCKPARFGWQREFRVVLDAPRSKGCPLILPVPGLNNVCQLIDELEPNAEIVRDEGGEPTLSFSAKEQSATSS